MGLDNESVKAARRSIELEPNYADGHAALAVSLNFAGKPEEALAVIQEAKVLNPLRPYSYVMAEGQSNYLLGNYETAAHLFEQVIDTNPEITTAYPMLVAIYIELGRQEDAEKVVGKLMAIATNFSIATEMEHDVYLNPEVNQRFIDSLRKAGIE